MTWALLTPTEFPPFFPEVPGQREKAGVGLYLGTSQSRSFLSFTSNPCLHLGNHSKGVGGTWSETMVFRSQELTGHLVPEPEI
jgi:hypothetical protein